jgi:hypothetical protein
MMTNIRSTVAACVAVATFAGAGSAKALLIDNTAATTGSISQFGAPDSATYGELFTTNGSDTLLNSFSLFLSSRFVGDDTLDLRGYIGTWTGSRVGSVLFSGATQTMNAAGTLQAFSYAPNLQLAANTQYVAFLSISEIDGQATNTFHTPFTFGGDNDASTNGFVFLNNGADESQWTTVDWATFFINGDMRMVANLSPRAQVPLPGTIALLGLGLVALGGLRRRAG